MHTLWIDITDIPAQGREFSFTDPEIWAVPAKEYGMDVVPGDDIEAKVHLNPQDKTCIVNGRISGTVTIPCDRCLQSASFSFDQQFNTFEELTPEMEDGHEPLIREHKGKLELDVGTILWEQFVLALPAKPLCSDECKGLCPQCGAELNKQECSCKAQGGDPRMAALRNLKIPSKGN
ncbi:YceD family protein [Desulfovibrio ferrophilus]|uniref:DUF177 domain-containing protein n=1 Tax=Desulfovibrio ferrophilus TaxID=241368 RepID=A0A2Z6B0I3_9BACT|nr:DUF177 domain-containing protein [Desulfovibrio ferrophilus]BBD08940.1 uncharacterized protein DFE_2214 [Desulfovibrio ferrophilus]